MNARRRAIIYNLMLRNDRCAICNEQIDDIEVIEICVVDPTRTGTRDNQRLRHILCKRRKFVPLLEEPIAVDLEALVMKIQSAVGPEKLCPLCQKSWSDVDDYFEDLALVNERVVHKKCIRIARATAPSPDAEPSTEC